MTGWFRGYLFSPSLITVVPGSMWASRNSLSIAVVAFSMICNPAARPAVTVLFYRDLDRRLAEGSAPVTPGLRCAEEGLVDLDGAAEPLSAGAHHRGGSGTASPISAGSRSRAPAEPEREIPCFWLTMSQAAARQMLSDVRVPSKIVPAVADKRCSQAPHDYRPSTSPAPPGTAGSRTHPASA